MSDLATSQDGQSPAPQIIPNSREAEEAVIGAVLINPEAYYDVAQFLQADDFYIHRHRWIWDVFQQLHERRTPIDFLTVSEELDQRNQLAEVGGPAYLTALINNVPTSLHAEAYGRIVEETAIRRRMLTAANDIAKLAYQEETSIDAVMDEAEKAVFGVSERRMTRDLQSIQQVLMDYYDRIDQLANRGEDTYGVPTGFIDLDRLLGGLQPSDLLIVAGRPGMGKCVSADTRLPDPTTGELHTIADLYQRRQADLLTLTENFQIVPGHASDFIDDGLKPVFRVRTALGREVKVTLTHPFLTYAGWQPLSELKVGDGVAVPRQLPVFGQDDLPDYQVKVLAYLLAGGNLTWPNPHFSQRNPCLHQDFAEAVSHFTGDNIQLNAQLECGDDQLRWIQFVKSADLATAGLPAMEWKTANNLRAWLESIEVWGNKAFEKDIPRQVFRLSRSRLALFLNRLFAGGGSISIERGRQVQVRYTTLSFHQAQSVQHLLLRFGVLARLRHRRHSFPDRLHSSYELEITDAASLRTFLSEIGVLGQEAVIAKASSLLRSTPHNSSKDANPLAKWEQIDPVHSHRSGASAPHAIGRQEKTNTLPLRRAPSDTRFHLITEMHCSTSLVEQAHNDVYWDEITEIEYVGEQQVYDLTVPGTHNFVADDILVHNTAFMLSVAKNAAQTYKKHVAIFSLEMSNEQLVQRLISQETGIDSQRLRTGKLNDDEWPLFAHAIEVLSDTRIFLDDTPALTPLQLRTKCRRLHLEYHLDLVVVDYLQLMTSGARSENRVQEVSYISRNLKVLARELNVPVLAAAQLSRAVEQRADKDPQLSDLRESGSLEQDSDIVMFIHRPEMYEKDTARQNVAQIKIAKHRNGPVGMVELVFRNNMTRFENAATRHVDLTQIG